MTRLERLDNTVNILMEIVPGLVVITLTVTLVYSYVRDIDNERHAQFRDWATNLVALYVGKSISDQAQSKAARQHSELYNPDVHTEASPHPQREAPQPVLKRPSEDEQLRPITTKEKPRGKRSH